MRVPSTFLDPSFSLNRLRTTPARKPRTECGCQLVAFIIAATVAPAGDCSIAITRDCFELASAFADLILPTVRREGFADGVDDLDFADNRFLADFVMEILRSVDEGSRRTTEAPPRRSSRRGRISGRSRAPKLRTVPLVLRPIASPFSD
jgi:hypothetical protein